MTLLNPTISVENLMYIGYPGDPSSAIRVTRRRHVDRQKQHSERNVLQCFIFGPVKAGKSVLLNSFNGRYFSCYLEVHYDNTISITEHDPILVEFILQATF
jgi:mitochondrial Rho GTPase 1